MNKRERAGERFITNERLSLMFSQSVNIIDKWGVIRQYYMENISEMLSMSKESITNGLYAYDLDWPSFFSPIEEVAWNSIRSHGNIVLYPQFPLFNYFIDFANPYLKIGLELDGEEYHDIEKDRKRDEFLSSIGWSIFRISGKEALMEYNELSSLQEKSIFGNEREQELHKWLTQTVDGLIYSIKYQYFGGYKFDYYMKKVPKNEYSSEETINLEPYILEALLKHRLVDFDIPNIPNNL